MRHEANGYSFPVIDVAGTLTPVLSSRRHVEEYIKANPQGLGAPMFVEEALAMRNEMIANLRVLGPRTEVEFIHGASPEAKERIEDIKRAKGRKTQRIKNGGGLEDKFYKSMLANRPSKASDVYRQLNLVDGKYTIDGQSYAKAYVVRAAQSAFKAQLARDERMAHAWKIAEQMPPDPETE